MGRHVLQVEEAVNMAASSSDRCRWHTICCQFVELASGLPCPAYHLVQVL